MNQKILKKSNEKKWKKELAEFYTGKEAEEYEYKREKKDARRFAEVQRQIDITKALLKLTPDSNKIKILDVACGTGRFFKLYGKRKIYGIDISNDMLKQARKSKKAVLKVADAEKIPYAKNSFDIVITAQFIQHLEDYMPYLKEMVRVCKSKGYLIMDFPNKYSLASLARFFKRLFKRAKRPYTFFTRKQIKKIAEKLDLEVIKWKDTIIISPVYFPKKMLGFVTFLNKFLIHRIPCFAYKHYVLFRKK